MSDTTDELPVEQKLLARRDGMIGEIVFNNPRRHNAVSLEMWQRMHRVLTEFAADPDLRVLIVSGAGGKAFVSGADISKFESERSNEAAIKTYGAASALAYDTLYNFPKPTIAKIHGYCIGGGVNLAVCCDLRVATDYSKFGIPAARLGLGYGYPGVHRLTEIVGISRAMELFYTARHVPADEALAIGLVNQVKTADEIDEFVAETARTISGNAPLTVATIKAVAREIGKPESARDLGKLDRMVAQCFGSEDYIEGRRAFMEKRKPQFKGR